MSTAVRAVTSEDADDLVRLVASAAPGVDARAVVADLIARGQTFVLDFADAGLAAVARVRVSPDTAHLDFLLVSPRADASIEGRMIAIAEALAAAHGCRAIDVVGARR